VKTVKPFEPGTWLYCSAQDYQDWIIRILAIEQTNDPLFRQRITGAVKHEEPIYRVWVWRRKRRVAIALKYLTHEWLVDHRATRISGRRREEYEMQMLLESI